MARTHEGERGAHALLSDGATVLIRSVLPSDHAGLRRLYDDMNEESRRLRFFGTGDVDRQTAERAVVTGNSGHRGLVAVHGDRIVGVAEYDSTTEPGVAEISLAVADDFHRRGVGTLLIEHLADAARKSGVTTFTADTLASNRLMQRLVSDLGLRAERRYADGEVEVRIALAPDESYRRAVDRRGGAAEAASLRPLLRPRTVAVVGAGTSPGSVGRAVLRKIRQGGFTGRLYAVNPHAHAILRVPCFPTVEDLPRTPDLAVLAIPAAVVPAVAEQCGNAGVRALVVLTSGLGADEADALLSTCRRHDIRLVGPNCLGIAVTDEHIRLDATFAADPPSPGHAGVAVQSGGVGIALLEGLARLGIGVSEFVSLGDKYDVSGNDLLQFWEADDATDMALLHLESFGNPRAFSRTARRVARRMPVLTVDAGRSAPGRRAAASHTAAAGTPTMTRRALFAQAGVTATRTIAELLDTAALLRSQPLPAGRKVAVVSNAGGAGVLAADACVESGLTVPVLPADLVAEVAAVLPEGSGTANPVDATAAVGESALRDCVDVLARHGAVDAVVVVLVPTALTAATGDDPVRALTRTDPWSRPCTVAAVLLGQAERVRLLHDRAVPLDPAPGGQGVSGLVPSYADPLAAAHALARAAERSGWLARPPGRTPDVPGTHPETARNLVARFLAGHPGGGWLGPLECQELLSGYAVPCTPTAFATTQEEAIEAVRELTGGSGRVAMKAYWPGLLHKSARGGVLLDIEGEGAVRAGYRELSSRFAGLMTGVIVQPMAQRGIELVAGVVNDGVFGPLVLFGLGGTATEVLADHAARLAPLTDLDVRDLVTAPRCAALLTGEGGAAPVDREALEQLLLRLSAMAGDVPQIAEAELNPVMARADGIVAVDARVRVAPRRVHDPYLRRLR